LNTRICILQVDLKLIIMKNFTLKKGWHETRVFLIALTTVLFLTLNANAQFQSDNFDSYSNGDTIGIVGGPNWTTWSNTPGSSEDAYVSNAQSASGSNSLELVNNSTDVLYLLGDETTGIWETGFKIWIDTGQSGYYNIQELMVPGTGWVIEVDFENGGTGFFSQGTSTFNYTQRSWVNVVNRANLRDNLLEIWIEDTLVYTGAYNAYGGSKTLGSYDFFPAGGNGPGIQSYIDDIYLKPVSDWTFDVFSTGDTIGLVDDSWTTWSVSPGGSEDAFVSSTFSQSGSNSLILQNTSTDALFLMGDKTTGTWETGFSIYVPTGNSAYYNIQNDETAGVAWMIDGWFDDDSTGYYEVGVANQVGTFTYTMNAWVDVRHYIDLDNDSIQVFVGGNFVYAGAYTANATNPTSQLGAYDFWPSGGNATGKTHYIDDMVLQPGTLQPIITGPVSDYTFDIFSAGDFIAVVDSSWNTWSGAPGTGEDALVSSTFSQSGSNSLELSLSSTDAVFEMGNRTSGVWETGFSVYVETGQSAYYNIQETEAPGTCWVVEVNFDDGGTGSQTLNSNAFTYTQGAWVDVQHFIDLDNDSIQLWIDGVGVAATKYSANGCNVKLGGYDFFPAGGNGPGIRHYIDDMVYQSSTMPSWPVGLEDRFTLDFQMFPNPAENNVTIINTYNGEITIRIKDAVGRTHQTMNSSLGTISIDVSELTSGIYFVEIQHQDSRGISKLVIR
jgi:Secretion system C-terminal sorting domain